MKQNQTIIIYFIIKGITDVPELQAPIFVLVLLIYLIVLVGNMSLLLVCLDSHLHTPMYFFLANMSIVDMTSSTVTLHKILLTFITGDNTILYLACIIQSYMFGSLSGHGLFILTAMSYDQYVAICRPLNYQIIMNLKICLLLASFCWMIGFIQAIPYVWFISKITCYSSNEIRHFFCDLAPFMENACSDITMLVRLSSHLTVIILLYTTLILQYAIPANGLGSKKLFSLFNTALVPVLNPLIYSLKNKDVKTAFRKRIKKWKVENFTVT